jgi:hypothetical protein
VLQLSITNFKLIFILIFVQICIQNNLKKFIKLLLLLLFLKNMDWTRVAIMPHTGPPYIYMARLIIIVHQIKSIV